MSAAWSQRSTSPLSFRARVSKSKGEKSLFGGAGVVAALTGTNAYLLVRVDDRGEPTTIYKKPTPNTAAQAVATLQPGEAFLISIDNAVSISATCPDDTFVDCAFVTKG